MSARRPLDVIQVRNPCPADWEQMAGDGQRRYCSHCNKYVHNLSAMPTDEAEKLACSAASSLCVRFAKDESTGRVMTLDYAPVPKTSRRRALATIFSLTAAVLGACGWTAIKLLRQPPPTRMMMGDIAPLPLRTITPGQ